MSLVVQSVVVPKKYSIADAEKKVIKLGYNHLYRGKKIDEYKAGMSRANYYGFRQRPPSQFDKNSFRTKKINDIFLVVGKLKSTVK